MSKRNAFLALVLLVPAPSIGALCAMVIFPDSWPGVLLFGVSKVWLLGLPIAWCTFVDRKPISFSPPKNGGFLIGLLSGLGLSGAILAVYLTVGDSLIDREFLVSKLTSIGLASRGTYICAAAYWILVNSVLEEYVWRWFCVKQCESLLRPTVAIIGSALFFTLHHIVAMRVYFGWTAVLVCAVGVFLGGTIWSAMYIRYRSIWPGYLSHAIVDLCIFAIAASMLF
ncbi:MAG: CPBP family intramembrane metalloprotease [Lentisphaerae bacterium]|nr:CPBP family intramembrane metalloprotease [Lentisphaerota bacterium]MBT4817894.1 CPBP family intramembrane metalloprotease [Lentisphaerota bacterium]MBT5605396.1 CPBP family intramembrane metalloprotease [Lentisphaerota bacterium]MBT7062020.1 CPBP family intramembrane metalloprotease [Lentisphaerota bacterium]MBT7848610.1 CPBP family intramembrane metalloprotease [Lentisphaerota bacterium]